MEEIFHYAILFFSLIAIVFTSGVLWRVEQRLDTSFKFFLVALLVFTAGVVLDILEWYQLVPSWQWQKIIKALFIIFFTFGVFEMRKLIMGLENKAKK